jgi:hypothetical protein
MSHTCALTARLTESMFRANFCAPWERRIGVSNHSNALTLGGWDGYILRRLREQRKLGR